MKAMELVRLGDASADAYEKLSRNFYEVLVIMTPFNEARDGLGLEDRPAEPHEGGGGEPPDNNIATISVSGNNLAGLKAPTKMRGVGRPNNSREKAPHENMSRRTRFCSICHARGHKRTTCQQRGDEPKTPRKPSKSTRCSVEIMVLGCVA